MGQILKFWSPKRSYTVDLDGEKFQPFDRPKIDQIHRIYAQVVVSRRSHESL
jgi:hypothetical protein